MSYGQNTDYCSYGQNSRFSCHANYGFGHSFRSLLGRIWKSSLHESWSILSLVLPPIGLISIGITQLGL